MGSNYTVDKLCLRYLVPFTIEDFEKGFEIVENQKEKINKKNRSKQRECDDKYRKLWERVTVNTHKNESDLYDYVKNEFSFDDDNGPLSEEKNGCEWMFWNSKELKKGPRQFILKFKYFKEGYLKDSTDPEDFWDINIYDLGLFLFRNNLGFLWYEITINPKQKVSKSLNSENLVLFQNRFRELTPKTKRPFFMMGEYEMEPFCMGRWIADCLSFLNVSFIAQRRHDEIVLPDKALLFTYISFGNAEGDSVYDREVISYMLTNGYKRSYHCSDETRQVMKHPFSDVIWFATQEGVSYLAWPGADNKAFFRGTFVGKVKRDYYYLYIKILFQSYSLLIYAQRIQKEISSIKNKFLDEPLSSDITVLFGEINLFLTKSMSTSVSHIHHQSEFYIYLKSQLRIQQDVNSITAGMDALDTIKREQRQNEENRRTRLEWKKERERDREQDERDAMLQRILSIFTFLSIFSALVDGFDFIGKFNGYEWGTFSIRVKIAEAIFVVGTVIFFIIAVIYLWRSFNNIRKSRISNRDEKDYEDEEEENM